MWETSKLYRHRNTTDVAIQVLDRKQEENGDWKLRVMWYNIGWCHAPWCMGLTQDVTVHNDRIPEWMEYKYERIEV